MRNLARIVIAVVVSALLSIAIEYHQVPGPAAFWVGLVTGASIFGFFEVMEER